MSIYPCYSYYYRQSPQGYCTFAARLSKYSPILNYSFSHVSDMDLPQNWSNLQDCTHTECLLPIYNRASKEIDNLTNDIYEKVSGALYELPAETVDTRLFIFLIRCIITFFAENEEKYEGSSSEKVNAALRDLRKQRPWVLEVLQMHNLTPSALNKILRSVAISFFDETAAL